ncbi:hypothetical protein [Wukongibacter sp. M2B1]|uniref:hypothetical protein n=1 Tax=Wukongibacter sp. M2B1 TaxID=3088895 RepID=UPI003D78BD06
MNVEISKILLIGIPETLLNIIFALLIWRGRDGLKEKSNIWKIPLACILIPIIAFAIKDYLDYSIIIQMVPLLIISSFIIKILWGTNKRCALLMSSMITFLIFISEIATMQLVSGFIQDIIKIYGFLHIKALLVWTMPTRVIQLVTVLILYKFNLTFENNKLLYGVWSDLSESQKITSHALFIHFLVAIFISAGYIEIFIKSMNNNISIDFIRIPLYIILLGSIFIILSTLRLLYRQTLLEDLKNIFFAGPSKLFENMLEASNEEQIMDYKLQLDNKIRRLQNHREEENK